MTAQEATDATWVDSPGINDKGKLDELATELARAGDILVWVVSSRHTFSLTEQSFLAAHVAEETMLKRLTDSLARAQAQAETGA